MEDVEMDGGGDEQRRQQQADAAAAAAAAPAAAGAGSDDDDDDNDDSDDDDGGGGGVEMSADDERRVMELEAALEANPSTYDSHLQLIELLRRCRLRARLRAARERMHALFPLNEAQWLDWVNDEIDALRDAEGVADVKRLFQLATQDYVSVALWEAYLEFLQAADPEVSGRTAAGAAAFREAAEAALTAAGLHLSEGHHLWALYRAYEQGLLDAGAGGDKQADRVRALFHRQLQLPQPKADALLAEYAAWEAARGGGGGGVPEHVRAAAARSAAAAQLRAPHEAAVTAEGRAADASLLAAYAAYIALEKAQKDPSRAALLYERAVAAFPVTGELWLQYARYVEAELRAPSVANAVYARAVRNCPWSGALWAAALRALERSGGDDAAHEALAERALSVGLQGPEDYLAVLLARADALRRRLFPSPPAVAAGAAAAAGGANGAQPPAAAAAADPAAVAKLRAWFARAQDLMAAYFGGGGAGGGDASAAAFFDPQLRLVGYAAHVEGPVLGDLAAMRAAWDKAVAGPGGRHAETWLAWAAMERSLRQPAAARAVYKRCYARKLQVGGGGAAGAAGAAGAGQAAVAHAWLRFEREEGGADDLFAAQLKLDPIVEEAAANAAAAAAAAAVTTATAQHRQPQPAAAAQRAAAHSAQQALSRDEVRARRRANDPNFKERKPGVKRDRSGDEVPAKRTREGGEEGGDGAAAAAAGAVAAGPAAGGGGAAAGGSGDADMADAGGGGGGGEQQQRPARRADEQHATVFVKGLGFDVGEDDLRALFADLGVRAVRIGLDRATGKSRGFAYVDLADGGAVERASERDGQVVNGRRLSIAKSAPPGGGGGGGRGGRGGRGGGGGFGGGRGGGGGGRGYHHDGGGGGRGGGGGGRFGLGHPRFHHPAAQTGHQRQHLQLGDGGPPPAPATGLVPRALQAAAAQQQQPKTNSDFKKMLGGGGGGGAQ